MTKKDGTESPDVAPLPEDPIVAEVRATREALAAASGYDLARIVADLRGLEAVERSRGRPILSPPSPVPGAAA